LRSDDGKRNACAKTFKVAWVGFARGSTGARAGSGRAHHHIAIVLAISPEVISSVRKDLRRVIADHGARCTTSGQSRGTVRHSSKTNLFGIPGVQHSNDGTDGVEATLARVLLVGTELESGSTVRVQAALQVAALP